MGTFCLPCGLSTGQCRSPASCSLLCRPYRRARSLRCPFYGDALRFRHPCRSSVNICVSWLLSSPGEFLPQFFKRGMRCGVPLCGTRYKNSIRKRCLGRYAVGRSRPRAASILIMIAARCGVFACACNDHASKRLASWRAIIPLTRGILIMPGEKLCDRLDFRLRPKAREE